MDFHRAWIGFPVLKTAECRITAIWRPGTGTGTDLIVLEPASEMPAEGVDHEA